MSARILGGKEIISFLQDNLQKQVQSLSQSNIFPCLAVCLVGDNPASHIYVRNKRKTCEKIGVKSVCAEFPSSVTTSELLALIDDWNRDKSIHGILIQLPLPAQVDQFAVLNHVSPVKDVDGFHALNMGKLCYGKCDLIPCTPAAVLAVIDYCKIPVLGRHVVIINDSIIVGRPLATLLTNRKATVTICNKETINLKEICLTADILVTAVGKRPDFTVDKSYCKKESVVIDVGINKLDRIVGDADESVHEVAQMVTKVPGGVGVITVWMLLKNLMIASRS